VCALLRRRSTVSHTVSPVARFALTTVCETRRSFVDHCVLVGYSVHCHCKVVALPNVGPNLGTSEKRNERKIVYSLIRGDRPNGIDYKTVANIKKWEGSLLVKGAMLEKRRQDIIKKLHSVVIVPLPYRSTMHMPCQDSTTLETRAWKHWCGPANTE
jgi:hypothetical protein